MNLKTQLGILFAVILRSVPGEILFSPVCKQY